VTATIDHDAPPAPEPPSGGPPGIPRWALVSFIVGGLAFLAIAIAAMTLSTDDADRAANDDGPWRGRLLEPAPERPDAVLVDTDGRPFDLRAETGGRFTLLFFGYTSCPDACPVQMAQLAQALDRVRLPIDVVFVTTDPERDTPERVRSWLDNFDSSFIGLTGTADQIDKLQSDMDVTVAIREQPDASGDYLVGHSTAVFVITPDDRAHLAYPTGTRIEDWVDDLPEAYAEPAWKGTRA
jgi:protein SCO1